MSETLTLRPYRPGDEAAILKTFNLVFREVCGPGFVDRTPEFWRWEFGHNERGHRIALAVLADGTVAAQYAGVPLLVHTSFGPKVFVHIVDSFVHPEHRKGLKKPGLFVETAMPWFEDCLRKGDAVLYGYPVAIAERIGQRYLEYHRLRVVDYLCRDVATSASAVSGGIQIERVLAFPCEVDALFATCAREKHCCTQRDARYLNWRYAEMPGDAYELFVARRAGQICGALVLRPVHELVPGACTIADWLVPEDDSTTADALCATAHERARAHGRRTVMAVFADPSHEHRALRAAGFEVVPSSRFDERRLTHRIYDRVLTTEWLVENWWYTLGDSDLV